jgi:group I intron endonuclease
VIFLSCGVYAIINRHNGKLYIGSSVRIENRWQDHLRLLQEGNHHNYYLQAIFTKYGKDNLEFKIIETCKKDCLKEREQYFMYRYNSTNSECGYNISLDATAPMRGREKTEKQKEVFRLLQEKLSQKGHSEETKKRMGTSHLKYSHFVDEWKEEIRH